MPGLQIEYRDPAKLKPDPGNARTHPKKQIDQIVGSIRSHGFVNPILIDEEDHIIAGHGRTIAAKQMELAAVPTIRLAGLSELQKRTLRLADNRIALNAAWDLDLLKVELESIRAIDVSFDFDIVGMASGEVDTIVFSPLICDETESVPAPPATAVSRPGDIWILGDHRVGCGDARDRDFMLELCGSAPVRAAFLDVPYNVKINGNAVGRGRHREFLHASGEMTSEAFRAFLREGLGSCAAVSQDGAVHFICIDHRHIEDLAAACADVYSERLNICVWNKSNGGMGSLYRSQHEFIFVMKLGTAAHLNAVELGRHGRNRTNVWDYPSVNTFRKSRRADLDLHPTVKPTAMVADAILDVTQPDDLVLDAYLGSGSTLLACLRTGRRFRGGDIDPAYVDLAVTRFMDLTGQTAIHEATEQTFSVLRRARGIEGGDQ